MGFKDLECLNQALLAKQARRLIHSDDCLMSRVMKAKYFENLDFATAPLGAKPSYAWRSILYGRDLLSKGLKRMVGNGRSMKVWTDPWLEDEEGNCRPPIRRQRLFDVNLMVSDLINPQTRRWDTIKINELFVPADIAILLQNQPVVSDDDSWLWKYTRNGLYKVKTGYDLSFSVKNEAIINQQNIQPSLNPLKAQVWGFKAPPKIKFFMWKAISNALAVNDCLAERGMKCDECCQVCGLETESVNHVLFSCTFSRQVWAISGFPSPPGGFTDTSLFQNMKYLFSTIQDSSQVVEIVRVFPWTLWYLWKNRNSLLFEGFLYDSIQIWKKAEDEASLWFVAQSLGSEGKGVGVDSEQKREVKWKKPPRHFFKCNIGMSWSKTKRLAGAAWVLRDSNGVVCLHSRRAFGSVGSKDEAFFLAFLWSLESMISHRIFKVHFAFEGSVLVNAINRPKAWPSFNFKVKEIMMLLENFLDWKVMFELPAANRGAQLIAQNVVNQNRFQSYVALGQPRWLSVLFEMEPDFR